MCLTSRLPDSQRHHRPDRRRAERESVWPGTARGDPSQTSNPYVVAQSSTLHPSTNFLLLCCSSLTSGGPSATAGRHRLLRGGEGLQRDAGESSSGEPRSRFVFGGGELVSRFPCSSPPSPTARITSSRSTMALRRCRESSTRWGNAAAHLHRIWTCWNVTPNSLSRFSLSFVYPDLEEILHRNFGSGAFKHLWRR